MEKQKFNVGTWIKFVLFSAVGVVFFFINVPYNGGSEVPMLIVINSLKAAVPAKVNEVIVMLLCVSTVITALWARSKNAPAWVKSHHPHDGWFSWFTYITSAIFGVMIIFNVGPGFILDSAVGMSSVNVCRDVVYAVVIAGGLVAFLTEFGLLEFPGILMEPIMRKCFRVPGKASIDALSSFVCAPSVGVMITNNLYQKKIYTQREAVTITTCFSVCSLGAFAFLSGMANCGEYYSQLVLCALVLAFVMAAIMVRIPPTSWKKNIYVDGEVQTDEQRRVVGYSKDTIPNALQTGLEKADSSPVSCIPMSFVTSFGFAQKVCAYVLSLSVIFLALANYTPIIDWLGVPVAPILSLLGLEDVELIAPSVLSGFFALSLPSTLLVGTGVSAASGFFVVLLSTSQIIFFTESANAMLESSIPVDFKDLVILFLERTVILIPICALVTHLVFGF